MASQEEKDRRAAAKFLGINEASLNSIDPEKNRQAVKEAELSDNYGGGTKLSLQDAIAGAAWEGPPPVAPAVDNGANELPYGLNLGPAPASRGVANRQPQSVPEVQPTQGIPASVAELNAMPAESGMLPSFGPVIEPLAKPASAPVKSPAETFAADVAKLKQSMLNQYYEGGAGRRTPEQAAAVDAELTKRAEEVVLSKREAADKAAQAAAAYESKVAARQQVDAYAEWKKKDDAVAIENERRAKYGAPLLPRPEAPAQAAGAPAPAVEDIIEQATQPRQEDIVKAASDMGAPAVQEASRAIAAAEDQRAAVEQVAQYEAVESKRALEAQKQLEDFERRETDEVRSTGLREMLTTGNLGNKLGAAIAVMLGGVSQGLTGAKSNPVLDYINTAVEQQAQKDKLTLAKKDALRKLIIEESQLKLNELKERTDSAYKKGLIDVAWAQLADSHDRASKAIQLEQYKAQKRAEAFDAVHGQLLRLPTADPKVAESNARLHSQMKEAAEANPKMFEDAQGRMIVLPNNQAVLAVAPTAQVQKFQNEVRPEIESGMSAITGLLDFSRNASAMSLKDQVLMKSKLAQAAGKLRIPITGPGVMTQDEYNRILESIGNPLKIFSFRQWEESKLKNTLAAMNQDLATRAGTLGVQWPQDREQKLRAGLAARGFSPAEIEAAVISSSKGK